MDNNHDALTERIRIISSGLVSLSAIGGSIVCVEMQAQSVAMIMSGSLIGSNALSTLIKKFRSD